MRLLRTEFASYLAPETGQGGGVAPPDASAEPPASSQTTENTQDDSASSSNEAFVLDAFDAMQVDDLDHVETTEPGPVAPQVAPPPSAQPTTAPTAPAQTSAAPPEPGIATPPAATGAQPPAAPQPGPSTPDEGPETVLQRIHEEVAKHQEVFTQKLAETVYKLPDKELESFNEDPASVIARVAARVHTNVVSSLTRVLSQQMPVYVHGLLQANERAQRNENEFWSANPFLDKKQHEQVVTQIAVMYKQMNPNATRADFIRTVGAMAMGALGLTAQAVGQRTAAQPPAVPQVQTPGRIVRNVPPAYQPAGAHSAPPGAHPAPQLNEWERMTVQLEQENQGAFDT